MKVCERSVLAGLGDGLHGVDVLSDVLEGKLSAHDVLYFVGAEMEGKTWLLFEYLINF